MFFLVPGEIGRPASARQWQEAATTALLAFTEESGAFVWPEAEAKLGELGWVTENVDPAFPRSWGIDPHHLATARNRLLSEGLLVEESATLSGRPVSAWVDGVALGTRGRATEVKRLAATKRRRYRTFLAWTGSPQLCGNVAESLVEATLRSLAGSTVWVPPSMRRGQVRKLLDRDIQAGGPLDAAGFWAPNPNNPTALVPFAVEVKNLRGVLYPWSHETWDLLAKLGAFPDVLPILVARRLHPMTYRFFKDVGAVGVQTRKQWFAHRHPLDPDAFQSIKQEFGFHDAELVEDTSQPIARVATFFSTTAYLPGQGSAPLFSAQLQRWRNAAPLADQHRELRNETMEPWHRRESWNEFAARMKAAGLIDRGGWGPETADD